MKNTRVRVNLQFTENLLADVDEMAERLNLSRSSFVSMALSKYMQQEKIMNVLPEFVELARKEQAKQLAE